MFGSAILEVAIGLVFVYLVFSIIGTAAVEAWSAATNCRGAKLRQWIVRVLGTRKADEFYKSPMIQQLCKDTWWPFRWPKLTYPSYIPEDIFADALACLLTGNASCPPTLDEIGKAMAETEAGKAIAATEAGKAIAIMIRKSNGNYDTFLSLLQKWFRDSQDRVNGWFKVSSVWFLLCFGFIIAFAGNVDTLNIANSLYKAQLSKAVVASAEKAGSSGTVNPLSEMMTLEGNGLIGWPEPQAPPDANPPSTNSGPGNTTKPPDVAKPVGGSPSNSATGAAVAPKPPGATSAQPVANPQKDKKIPAKHKASGCVYWLLKVLGFFLTALAMSLGAPYWFEVLNKLNQTVRATGVKPQSGDSGDKKTDGANPPAGDGKSTDTNKPGGAI
jgi:hypothetical protein